MLQVFWLRKGVSMQVCLPVELPESCANHKEWARKCPRAVLHIGRLGAAVSHYHPCSSTRHVPDWTIWNCGCMAFFDLQKWQLHVVPPNTCRSDWVSARGPILTVLLEDINVSWHFFCWKLPFHSKTWAHSFSNYPMRNLGLKMIVLHSGPCLFPPELQRIEASGFVSWLWFLLNPLGF